jgi:hypothetical protein
MQYTIRINANRRRFEHKNTLSFVACLALALTLTALEGRSAFAADKGDATEAYGLVIGNEFNVPHCAGTYSPSFPTMSNSAEIGATVLNKRLAGLVIETSGFKDIKDVFPQLVAKFGEPTTKQVGVLQNGFGAKFPSMIATWKRRDVTVTYDSHPFPDVDDGHVTIYTPEATELRSNGGKKNAKQGYTPL